MRKGALKKKQRQLEELHLDRREALGELAYGMFVQNSWDENLLAKGASEVGEVEAELEARKAGQEPEPGSAEHDLPETGEHRRVDGEGHVPQRVRESVPYVAVLQVKDPGQSIFTGTGSSREADDGAGHDDASMT